MDGIFNGLLLGRRRDANQVVEIVIVCRRCAIDIVPPVANEDALVENGAVRTEEREFLSQSANVVNLFGMRINKKTIINEIGAPRTTITTTPFSSSLYCTFNGITN